MPISGREKAFDCSAPNCAGHLSQVHPDFNLFRCVACKALQNVQIELLLAERSQNNEQQI